MMHTASTVHHYLVLDVFNGSSDKLPSGHDIDRPQFTRDGTHTKLELNLVDQWRSKVRLGETAPPRQEVAHSISWLKSDTAVHQTGSTVGELSRQLGGGASIALSTSW